MISRTMAGKANLTSIVHVKRQTMFTGTVCCPIAVSLGLPELQQNLTSETRH